MAEWVSVHTCVSEWCVTNSQAWCFHYAGDVLGPIQTNLRSLAPSFSLDGELEECGTPLYLQNPVLEKDFLQQKPQADSVWPWKAWLGWLFWICGCHSMAVWQVRDSDLSGPQYPAQRRWRLYTVKILKYFPQSMALSACSGLPPVSQALWSVLNAASKT